jgi:hypothetical protein
MQTLKKPIIYSIVLIALGSLLVAYSRSAQADVAIVDFLIVAGGGSGGGNNSNTSGGGGGGGEVALGSTTVSVTSYSITVGAGGAAVATTNGNNGGNSSAFGTTTLGGGAGSQGGNGVSGGTGGGGGGGTGSSATTTGGSATGSYFGYDGGYGQRSTSAGGRAGGGGGGAGGAGQDTSGSTAGNGGVGYLSSISGSATYYGGGGGGASGGSAHGSGGTGGGGSAGAATSSRNGTNGLGGGGAGLSRNHTGNSGAGGSGVVIISYQTGTMTATGGTTTTSGGNTIHTFTSSGTFTVTAVGAPPTPDPMFFHSPPAAVSTSSISMTATTSVDASPPVEYFFGYEACGTHAGTGGTNSAWQTSTSYTDSGLQINQCYGYTIAARDSLGNTTGSSSVSEAYTLAAVPGAPTLADQTTTSMKITNNANGNPSHTTYAVQVLNTSPNDAAWEDLYLDSDGTASTSPVWLSDAQIDAITIVGLTIDTYYEVRVKARNGDEVETSYSAVDSLRTNDGSTISPPSDGVQTWIRGGTRVRGRVSF